MKKRVLSLALGLLTLGMSAQLINGSVSMGPSYQNQIFYKLSDQSSNSFAANSWDLAFNRQSAFEIGIRVNDHKGITVYEASNNISNWNTIDVANVNDWSVLSNSDTTWGTGALNNGSATYGWGEYNMASHTVAGSVIFVLKYSATHFKKLKIDSALYGYTFTYSTWDGTAWSADTTYTLPNANNPSNLFNYYNLETNAEVVAEPAAAAWDLKFTKYTTLVPAGEGEFLPYLVTGVLHHPTVTVAENVEETTDTDTSNLTYSADINVIGSDWKTINSSYQYDVNSNKAFYIKLASGTIYRLVFSTFAGSSTGNITFNQEDVTTQLSTVGFSGVQFGVFPNPSTDKKINLVYDGVTSNENKVAIYNMNGVAVLQQNLASTGFQNQTLDLSALSSGIYMLEFTSGSFREVKKIVLQ